MSGLLGSLHTASTGMRTNQTVIQTINHNITNMNTPGYSRQRAELATNRPYATVGRNTYTTYAGQIGQGVSVNSVVRIRNSFYDYQYRAEAHSYGNAALKYEHLSNIEGAFNEPSDNGISSSLNNLFNCFNEISKNPESTPAKNYLMQNAKVLTNSINQVVTRLDSLKSNMINQEEGMIKDINTILDGIKTLDAEIKILEATGKNPNDLLDSRDKLIDELSFKLNINSPDVQNALADGTLTSAEIQNLDVSGELQAVKDMQTKIDEIYADMKTFMNELTDQVNDIYSTNIPPQNAGPIFVLRTDANGLTNIDVNSNYLNNPELLTFSADSALELSDLRSLKLNINGENVTLGGFYNSIVQDVGYATQAVKRELSNRESLMNNIENCKASISGVSLDEEMVNLIQYQHAYNATAKVASTIDSLLDVVINGIIK